MPPEPPLAAAGPFGSVLRLAGDRLAGNLGADANALVVLNRVAFIDVQARKLEERGKRALLGWACQRQLGQEPGLIDAVSRRREAALRAISGRSRCYLRLRAEPEWRLAVGHGGKANAHEIGLALHGTYGWPVIPGSALKGLTAAWAVTSGADPGEIRRVLGGPRPGSAPSPASPAGQGSVRFLDAIPDGRPVDVVPDVLAPHVKPYYDSLATGPAVVPPAEYHNPVPVTFLTVRGGYAVDLYGASSKDVGLAAEWLTAAGDELGAGAKTAAGYGYLTVTPKAGVS